VRDELVSISDPRIAEWLTAGQSDAGAPVTERTALTLSAFYRGLEIVSGSIGGLPLRTLRDVDGARTRFTSLFDNPGAVVGMDLYNWKKIQVLHKILWGDAFLRHYFNAAGALVGMGPIHPSCVKVEWDAGAEGGKLYSFNEVVDGKVGKVRKVELDRTGMTQVMGTSLDGLRGLSVLTLARTSLGGAIAGDKAAAKLWRNGMMLGGLVTPPPEADPDEVDAGVDKINSELTGVENAGSIRALNQAWKFTPWSMPAKDAQFLESRQFSIQECARWLGVHPNLLMDPGAVSTWGTGVEIQNRSLGRFTLTNHTIPMQEAYSAALRGERFVEFDYAGLERGSPREEIDLLLAQVDGGLLTLNEARKIRNLPPVDGGDVLRVKGVPVTALAAQPGQPGAKTAARLALGSSPFDTSSDHAMVLAGAVAELGALS